MEEVLQQLGVGIRPVNDPYFDESYKVCRVLHRRGITIDGDEELCHNFVREFPCNILGCKATFQTLLDYEIHYNSSHRYVCNECKISRPNPRLLEIHIQEAHDTFFKVMSQKQAIYQCYDSECDIKFKEPAERKEHCIKVHKFPKKYRFDDTVHYSKEDESNKMEIDHADSKSKNKTAKIVLNKNQKSKMFTKAAVNTAHVNIPTVTMPSISKMSSLAFIPRQVQKSYSKVLTDNQNREKDVLETDIIMELAEALPN